MKKEQENFTQDKFDEEYALWLLSAFPKSIKKNAVSQWRFKNKIPECYYFVSPLLIHGIPLNTILLFEGHKQKEVAKEIGVLHTNLTQYIINGNMPEKYVDLLEKKYIKYKGKKNLVPKLKVVHEKHYFLEYDSDMVHLKAVHSAQTKNRGILFFSKTMFVSGEIAEKKIDGIEFSDFIKRKDVCEVNFKRANAAIRLANKNIKSISI